VCAWSWERSRRGPAWREGLNVIYTIYTIYRSARSLQVNLSIMHAAHYCLIDEMKPKLGGRSNLNASNVVINMCLKALSLHQGSGRRPNTRSTTVAAKHEVDLRSEYYPFLPPSPFIKTDHSLIRFHVELRNLGRRWVDLGPPVGHNGRTYACSMCTLFYMDIDHINPEDETESLIIRLVEAPRR
jgi:hypothetical protein